MRGRSLLLALVMGCSADSVDIRVDPSDTLQTRPGPISTDFADPVDWQRFDPDAVAGRWRSFVDPWQRGRDRLGQTQTLGGGWPWPLSGPVSVDNTVGPISLGYAAAGDVLDDPTDLTGAADFLLTKASFTGLDGLLAAELDARLGSEVYSDHVRTAFLDALAAGTYTHRDGYTATDTADYVAHIVSVRNSRGAGNLAAWDLSMHFLGALAVDHPDAEVWLAGVRDAVEALVIDDRETDGVAHSAFDVLGLAGGVWALATAREDFDPAAGAYVDADSTEDLVAALVALQIPETGGWPWTANLAVSGGNHESVQATAYAMLAAETWRPSGSLPLARGYAHLIDRQLPNGGWEDFVGSGENNEMSGEALWACAAHQAVARVRLEGPDQQTWVVPSPCGQPPTADLDVVLYDLTAGNRGLAGFRFGLQTDLQTDAQRYRVLLDAFGAANATRSRGVPAGDDVFSIAVEQDPSTTPRVLDEGVGGVDRRLAQVRVGLPTVPGDYTLEVEGPAVAVYNRIPSGQVTPRVHEAVVHVDGPLQLRVTGQQGDADADGDVDADDLAVLADCLAAPDATCVAVFDADCDADLDADDEAVWAP
jgi:hypothetical protein